MDERMELNDLRALQEYFSNKLIKLNDRQKRLEEDEDGEDDEEGEEGEEHESEQGSRPPTHSDQSESEEEDDVVELPNAIKPPPKFRKSVSAEAYGLYNKKGYFSARVIEKGADTNAKIKERLLQSFMFSSLDNTELDVVIQAMEEKIFNKNETVIQQGDDGDELFVVGEGKLH